MKNKSELKRKRYSPQKVSTAYKKYKETLVVLDPDWEDTNSTGKQYQSVTTDIDMAQNQLIDIGSLAKELKKELITDIQTTVEKTIEKYMIPIKRDLVKIKNDYQKLEQEVSDLRLKK